MDRKKTMNMYFINKKCIVCICENMCQIIHLECGTFLLCPNRIDWIYYIKINKINNNQTFFGVINLYYISSNNI